MLNETAINAIGVVTMLQAMWEQNGDTRKDFYGLKPRTRRGYARLMLKERARFFGQGDNEAAFRLRIMWRTDTNVPV